MKVGYKNFAYAAYKMNTRFYVRSVGNFQLEEGEELPEKRAEFPEIFWCVSGTGSFVLDAACAIGALPSPASFENTPRAKPYCIARTIP